MCVLFRQPPAKNRDFACTVLMRALQHKRLVLRPDDIFLPLLDAAATHVFQNGDASRNVFVSHQDQKVRGGIARSLRPKFVCSLLDCRPSLSSVTSLSPLVHLPT